MQEADNKIKAHKNLELGTPYRYVLGGSQLYLGGCPVISKENVGVSVWSNRFGKQKSFSQNNTYVRGCHEVFFKLN